MHLHLLGDGRAAADEAAEAARRTFEEGSLAEALPTVELPRSEFAAGMTVAVLFVRAGLAGSNGEVRRAVANNAVRINDKPIGDAHRTVTLDDLNADGVVKLSLGKKKHALAVPA